LAEFSQPIDRQRGKDVGIARAADRPEDAKPLCIGNWSTGCKILSKVDAMRSTAALFG
jgi:hypothetical protein